MAEDQCPPGVAWYKGEACVVAVVQFNQSLITAKEGVNVTTFGTDGSKLRTAWTPDGVVILRFPSFNSSNASDSNSLKNGSIPLFASVKYREEKTGRVGEDHYAFIDHLATASSSLTR